MPPPWQHQIWAASVLYATTRGNAGSLTHWTRPGIDPTSSQGQHRVLNLLSCNGNASLCTFIEILGFTPILSFPIQHRRAHFLFLPFHVWNTSSDSERPGFHFSKYPHLFDPFPVQNPSLPPPPPRRGPRLCWLWHQIWVYNRAQRPGVCLLTDSSLPDLGT